MSRNQGYSAAMKFSERSSDHSYPQQQLLAGSLRRGKWEETHDIVIVRMQVATRLAGGAPYLGHGVVLVGLMDDLGDELRAGL